MSLWVDSVVKQVDGFERDWWIRTQKHKAPFTERTQIITCNDPALDDCDLKMEICSQPVKTRSMGGTVEMATSMVDLISENDKKILNPNDWTISQKEEIDRVGPTSFAKMPFGHFLSYWRQPLDPRYIDMWMVGNGTAMIGFRYMDANHPMYNSPVVCTLYLNWKGLFDDLLDTPNQKILPWLRTHCNGKLYLFSDFDTIFESPEDEFRFIVDIL